VAAARREPARTAEQVKREGSTGQGKQSGRSVSKALSSSTSNPARKSTSNSGLGSTRSSPNCLDEIGQVIEAYLALKQGKDAVNEFQKILDHRTVVRNSVTGALAHWGLGRAYALEGDTARAKAAYAAFFSLWKEADHDIPVLVAAKTEYEKLK
jgi:hypothetical protein